MNFSQSVTIFLTIGLFALSSDSFARDIASTQGEGVLGTGKTTRVMHVAPMLGRPTMFKNGQLLRQPRNALTTSGWTYDEQSALCEQIDAGDQAAWTRLQEEVTRQQPWAQRVMAMYYLEQRSPLVVPDLLRSLQLYRLAAKQGDLSSQYELGWRLLSGTGFIADHAEARYWLEKASSQDNSDAKTLIGEMLRDGRGGEQNFEGAAFEFRVAANDNNGYALVDLAAAYANGEGLERNFLEAYKWLIVADRGAGTGAFAQALRSHKATLAKRITPQDMNEATKRANTWLSQHPPQVHTLPPKIFGPEFDPGAPCKRPTQPEESKARSEKGKVVIQVKVDARGKVEGVDLVKSSGFALLDQATVTGVTICQFVPALRFGVAVEGTKEISVDW